MQAELRGSQITVQLNNSITSIGRSSKNQFVLAGAEVSWVHARIELQGPDYFIIDMGSSNGTYVNGHKLSANTPHRLKNGDAIRFGNLSFQYITSTSSKGATSHPPTASMAHNKAAHSDSSTRKNTPGWVKIAGGFASLSTVFVAIWGVFTYLHPSSLPDSPTPIATPTHTIPVLHASYTGTLTRVNDGRMFNFVLSTVTEDTHGHFTAMAVDTCPAQIDGNVNADNEINFTLKQAQTQNCDLVGQFKGEVFPDGHLAGTWQGPVSQVSGTWSVS